MAKLLPPLDRLQYCFEIDPLLLLNYVGKMQPPMQ